MRVQVTKDAWGISVWNNTVKLAYCQPMWGKPGDMWGLPGERDTRPRLPKEPIWMPEKFHWRSQRVFKDRVAMAEFKDLADAMAVGEIREMGLILI
jgi:hypothetical protein